MSNKQRIERIDYVDKSIKKKIFPQYYKEYEWRYGIDSDSVLEAFCSVRSTSGIVLCVEGCMNAYRVLQRGINSISFQTYSNAEIDNGLNKLSNGVIIISDNDVTGKLKAKKILEKCWSKNISAIEIEIKQLWSYLQIKEECKSGYDIVDLFEVKDVDLNILLDSYFRDKAL